MSEKFLYLFAIVAMLFTSVSYTHAQSSIYKQASGIINSKQKDNEKLVQLYQLKKETEEKQQTNDTGYITALLKIASLENDKGNDSLASTITILAAQKAGQPASKASLSLRLRANDNAAAFLFISGAFDKAVRFYDTVLELSSRYDPDDYHLNARFYHTYLDDQLGDYEKVINESTLGLAEAAARKNTLFYSRFLYFSARALMLQEQTAIALEKADECIRVSTETKDTFQLANAYNIKAWICKNQNQYEEAERYYKLALHTRQQLPDDYNALSLDYNDLGLFYLNEKRDFRKANDCFRKVIQYAGQCLPAQRSRKLFIALCNQGDMYVSMKLPFKALASYGNALQYANMKEKDFVNSNPAFYKLNVVPNKEGLLSILSSKCALLLQLYKTSNKQVYLQNCLKTALLADTLVTQMRHEQLGEKSKLYWRNKTHYLFSNAVEASFLSGNAELAFYFMEKSHSTLLSDRLTEMTSHTRYVPKQETDTETDLQRSIVMLEKQLGAQSPASSEYSLAQNKLSQTKESLEKHIKSIERNYPRYYQYKYADDVPSLSELTAYVKKNNQSFLYYFVNDSAIYALGVSGKETKFIKIKSKEFDSHKLSDFVRLCSNKQATNGHYEDFSSLAQTIYTQLFQPFHLSPGKVVVCSDNFFIPFEALCTDKSGRHFLLNDYDFHYVYSARSLLKPFVCNSKPSGEFAGFAPITFSPALHVFSLQNSSSALEKAGDCYADKVLFTGQQSTRNNFLSQASKYAVVTIFSHAQADTTDKEPVLYMQDSLIHLSELQMLNNPATQLVLLSACQTNIGKNATGEGIYSLARGFAAAGVPAVSATLWKADEEAIYRISQKFNEYLAAGTNKSDALQKAKLWYLENSDREHALPYYWANLVLIGSSDPIVLKNKSSHSWIWIAAMAFGISVVTGLFFYRHYARKTKNKV